QALDEIVHVRGREGQVDAGGAVDLALALEVADARGEQDDVRQRQQGGGRFVPVRHGGTTDVGQRLPGPKQREGRQSNRTDQRRDEQRTTHENSSRDVVGTIRPSPTWERKLDVSTVA